MPPVPKKKHTRSRSNKRRNAPDKKAVLPNLGICPKCKKFRQTHTACPRCGFYK